MSLALKEVQPALEKLMELGLPEDIEGLNKFYEIVEDYVNNGNPFTGVIKIPELKREFQCMMSNNKKHPVTVSRSGVNRGTNEPLEKTF